MKSFVVIVAAGSGSRMGGSVPKVLLPLAGKPALHWSLEAFAKTRVDGIVLVASPATRTAAEEAAKECAKPVSVVEGGATRLQSVQNGVAAVPADADLILVHDAARPCVTPVLIEATIASALCLGSGVAARKVVDTVKSAVRTADGVRCEATVDRTPLWTVQTPQTFRADLLRRALEEAQPDDPAITDEASAVERLGMPVHLVESDAPNPKLTVPSDVPLAELILADRNRVVSGNKFC